MFEHRGVEIRVDETNGFSYRDPSQGSEYEVVAKGTIFYVAHSPHGKAFAMTGPEALALSKGQIDRALSK